MFEGYITGRDDDYQQFSIGGFPGFSLLICKACKATVHPLCDQEHLAWHEKRGT